MLAEIQGHNPTRLQLTTTYGLFVGTTVLIILWYGMDWKSLILAVIAGDWAAGIVANSARSTRDWWRDRLTARRVFLVIHLLEVPLVWWLCAGDSQLFGILMLTLFAKLSVFLLGREAGDGHA